MSTAFASFLSSLSATCSFSSSRVAVSCLHLALLGLCFSTPGLRIVLDDAALQAVYGDEEQLSVFIDHVRLGEILSEASKRDPDASGLAAPLLEAMDLPGVSTPSLARAKR